MKSQILNCWQNNTNPFLLLWNSMPQLTQSSAYLSKICAKKKKKKQKKKTKTCQTLQTPKIGAAKRSKENRARIFTQKQQTTGRTDARVIFNHLGTFCAAPHHVSCWTSLLLQLNTKISAHKFLQIWGCERASSKKKIRCVHMAMV